MAIEIGAHITHLIQKRSRISSILEERPDTIKRIGFGEVIAKPGDWGVNLDKILNAKERILDSIPRLERRLEETDVQLARSAPIYLAELEERRAKLMRMRALASKGAFDPDFLEQYENDFTYFASLPQQAPPLQNEIERLKNKNPDTQQNAPEKSSPLNIPTEADYSSNNRLPSPVPDGTVTEKTANEPQQHPGNSGDTVFSAENTQVIGIEKVFQDLRPKLLGLFMNSPARLKITTVGSLYTSQKFGIPGINRGYILDCTKRGIIPFEDGAVNMKFEEHTLNLPAYITLKFLWNNRGFPLTPEQKKEIYTIALAVFDEYKEQIKNRGKKNT